MPRYPVLDRLNHDGKTYEAGKSVAIDDAEAAEQLIELGVIGPALKAEKADTVPPAEKPATTAAATKTSTPKTSAKSSKPAAAPVQTQAAAGDAAETPPAS